MLIEKSLIMPAVYGGAFYGGGGGGWIRDGLEMAGLAVSFGHPQLIDIGELPPDKMLCMTSMIGAPAAKDRQVLPVDFIRSYRIFAHNAGVEIAGLTANENGAVATINGWLQSAVLGIPVVDAPGNGRAHPTGIMGSIGLNGIGCYISKQSAVGGNSQKGRYMEIYTAGEILSTSALIRQVADRAGGLVAVTRNPVTTGYAKDHGAPGAIKQAIKVGEALLSRQDRGPVGMIGAAVDEARGEILAKGTIKDITLHTAGGYDVGSLSLVTDRNELFCIDVWNEYLTLECEGDRLATFPDLIALMSPKTGLPLISAEIAPEMPAVVVKVPRSELILGAGMYEKENFVEMEKAIDKDIISYVF